MQPCRRAVHVEEASLHGAVRDAARDHGAVARAGGRDVPVPAPAAVPPPPGARTVPHPVPRPAGDHGQPAGHLLPPGGGPARARRLRGGEGGPLHPRPPRH